MQRNQKRESWSADKTRPAERKTSTMLSLSGWKLDGWSGSFSSEHQHSSLNQASLRQYTTQTVTLPSRRTDKINQSHRALIHQEGLIAKHLTHTYHDVIHELAFGCIINTRFFQWHMIELHWLCTFSFNEWHLSFTTCNHTSLQVNIYKKTRCILP